MTTVIGRKEVLKSKRGRRLTTAEWEFATDDYKELRKGRKMKATQFKEYRDDITEGKFPRNLIAKALKIAKKSGGQMTKAWKQIEKIKKGLGDDPVIADALRVANEEAVAEWNIGSRRVKGGDGRRKLVKAQRALELATEEDDEEIEERKLTDKELKRREEIAKNLDDEDLKKRYGADWKAVKMGIATNMAKAESVEEASRYKGDKEKLALMKKWHVRADSLLGRAIRIAVDMGGNMTGAIKKIEKIKRGISDHKAVQDALKTANEELDERDYRKEYDNYQGTPDQIARRSSRNKARRVMGDDCEDGLDVGHKDNNPMNNDRANLRNEDPSKNRREPRLRKEAEGENKKLLKQYKKNEDRNAHSENYLLLAKAFGNPKQVKEVEAILKRNKKQGSTSEKDNKWMYKNINPYYKKLVSSAKSESFSGYREAENLPEYLEFGTDETTKNYKDKTPGESNEAKAKYKIDHKTYSSAVDEALKVADKQGYEVDMDDYFNQIATGPRKPGEGKTNTFKIALTKRDKPQKKKLQIQIYGKGKHGYELNCYIS